MVPRPSPLSTNSSTEFRRLCWLASKPFPRNSQIEWKLDFVPLLKRWAGCVFNITQAAHKGRGFYPKF